MRRGLVACLLCARLLWPAAARGEEDTKKTCAAAYSAGQRLMRSGNLLEARKKLVLCGSPACPAVMQPDCQQWLASVENSIPTVVFQISPETSVSPQDVHLSLDGGDSFALDGRAVSLDPGTHSITFAANGFHTVTRQFVVSEGEKLRREVVSMEPIPPAPRIDLAPKKPVTALPAQPARGARSRWPVILALSGTTLATAGAIAFGVKARNDDRNLDSCDGNCSWQTVDHVKKEYLVTNILIGVAVAGLATAVVLWVVQRRPPSPSTSTAGTLGLTLGTF